MCRAVSITLVGGAVRYVPQVIMETSAAPSVIARYVPAPCGTTGNALHCLFFYFNSGSFSFIDFSFVCVCVCACVCV